MNPPQNCDGITSQNAAAQCIQTWFRNRLYKEWKTYTHPPATHTIINTYDILTFHPIQEIPYYRRFYIQEEAQHHIYTFCFDIDTFYHLLHHSHDGEFLLPFPRPRLNPYTRNPITEYQMYCFYRTIHLYKLLFPYFPYKIQQSMTSLSLFECDHLLIKRYSPRTYDLRLKILMEELADLEPKWEVVQGIRWWKEITSDPSKNKQLYRVLSVLLKKNIYPMLYGVRFSQNSKLVDTSLLCLDICEYFLLSTAASLEERESTATSILTALTVVSKEVRVLFPWLYMNYW